METIGTQAADLKCVLAEKQKCVEGWDRTGNLSCVHCKNVGYHTVSTLVRTLRTDLCLQTVRWIRAEALNSDGLYSTPCSTRDVTIGLLSTFPLHPLVRIIIVPPLYRDKE